MRIRSAKIESQAPKPLDSNWLSELEDRVRYGANWLIYLSILTIFAGFALSPPLAAQGVLFLGLSILLRLRQSRAAALVLCAAAAASFFVGMVSIAAGGPSGIYVGLAQPVLALATSVLAAVNAFRLHHALQAPLAANRDAKSDA